MISINDAIVDPKTGCWNWKHCCDSNGYGMVSFNGKATRVHRLSVSIWKGLPLYGKHVVRHTCDNPRCFNPEHLIPGTQTDNMIDCSQKGRTANSKKKLCKRGHPLYGDNLYLFTKPNGAQMRTCRECRRNRIRDYMRKRRHAAALSRD